MRKARTNKEKILRYIAGEKNQRLPQTRTREEEFLKDIAKNETNRIKKEVEDYLTKNPVKQIDFDTENYNLYDIQNLQKKLDKLENEHSFIWKGFDKGYVSFRVDDLLNDIGDIATIFENKNVPLTVAAIPANLTPAKKAVLEDIVDAGGEILCHNASVITADSTELDVIKYCRNSKATLENNGFIIRGLALSGGQNALTNWITEFEKIAERYYDYADIGGASEQYAMWSNGLTNGVDTVKGWIDTAKTQKRHLTIYLHSLSEANVTQENIEELIDYCVSQGVGITTPAHIYDTFGNYSYGVYKKSEVDAIVTELRELIGAGGGGTVTIPNAIFNLLGSSYSGNNYTDTISNSVVTTSLVDSSIVGSPAATENGVELTANHILKCTLDSSVQMGTNPFAIEIDCTFSAEDIAALTNGTVFGLGPDANTAWNASICWYAGQSVLKSGDSQTLALAATEGTHKIVITRDVNNVITAYVDTIASKVTGTFTTIQTFNAFKIYAVACTLRHIKIYNYALTEVQVKQLLHTN